VRGRPISTSYSPQGGLQTGEVEHIICRFGRCSTADEGGECRARAGSFSFSRQGRAKRTVAPKMFGRRRRRAAEKRKGAARRNRRCRDRTIHSRPEPRLRFTIRQSRESFPLESQAEGPFRETDSEPYRWYTAGLPAAIRRAALAALGPCLLSRMNRAVSPSGTGAPLNSHDLRLPAAARAKGRSFSLLREQRAADGRVRGGARIFMTQRLLTDLRVPSRGSQPRRHAKAPTSTTSRSPTPRVATQGPPPASPRPINGSRNRSISRRSCSRTRAVSIRA
jgi:hypothetical protein